MRVILGFLRFLVTLAMVVVAGILLVALWRAYMLAPWTRDGRVRVEVVDVAPEIPGTVVKVPVHDNEYVHKGDVLFVLDPVRFRLAIDSAQAALESAQAQYRLRQSDQKRRRGLAGIVSAEEVERVASTASVAAAQVDSARAALALAKLNLQRSVLYAPCDGWVTSLRLRVGDYASAGQPRVAVIDAHSFWVDGYFEETKLARIHVGEKARIKLMGYAAPLGGHVESIGRGIGDRDTVLDRQGLPDVSPVFTWVRLAQRIPVRIAIDSVPAGITLSAGMTGSVSIGDSRAGRGRLLGWLEDHL